MKYSDKNKPLVCMQTQSTCYKGTRTMQVLGVLWHSTGANNPYIKRYVQPSDNAADRIEMLKLLGVNIYNNDWNHISRQAGLNCWVGKLADGTVSTVQTMPWNYRPWGCGAGSKGSCNTGWIQFEICEDALTDKNYFNAVYKEACEITAYLCKLYNIDPHGTVTVSGVKLPTILCHYDSYKYGFGGNHGDVYNWFNRYGKTMDDVRNDVAALLKSSSVTPAPTPDLSVNVNYQGKVAAKAGLNCRTEPVTGNVIKTYPNNTVLTISKELNGWGYTGEGWVSLEYIEKVKTESNQPTADTTEKKEDNEMLSYEQWKAYMDQYRKDLQDNDCSGWSEKARQFCVDHNIFSGAGTDSEGNLNFMWEDLLTREQCAQVLYAFAKKFGLAEK